MSETETFVGIAIASYAVVGAYFVVAHRRHAFGLGIAACGALWAAQYFVGVNHGAFPLIGVAANALFCALLARLVLGFIRQQHESLLARAVHTASC